MDHVMNEWMNGVSSATGFSLISYLAPC
jgi:hypothetical protein